MNLSDHPRLRLMTLCALYVSQGIPFGFVTVTLKAYLTERGLDVGQIGTILAMGTLPWSFKWLWGPLIDRYGFPSMGRRRPWILIAQLLMAITVGAMIAIPDLVAGVAVLSWMVFAHNVFSSLQDVSVDALAVDLLEERERGKANGLMYGSSWLGTFIGGAGLGSVLGLYGLRAAMIVQVGLLGAIMMLPLLLRERAGERLVPWPRGRGRGEAPEGSPRSVGGLFASLGRAFSLRSTILAALVALGVKLGVGVFSAAFAVVFMGQYGWTKETVIQVEGGYGVWLGLAGSVAGGFLADLVGPKRLAATTMVLLGLTWIGFSALCGWWPSRPFATAFLLTETTLVAVMSVSLFALFMGISWPVVAATQFTAYMALLNLSQTVGAKLAGPLCQRFDLREIYLAAGVLQFILLLPLALIDPRQTRRVLGDGTDAG